MRINWWAILVCDVVLFLFGWLWYDLLFGNLWMSAVKSASPQLGAAAWYPFAVSLVTGFFLAYGLARILIWRGPVGPFEGAWIGFAFGLLIFGTMTWMDYAYSGFGMTLGYLNVGYVAVGMGIQGAILAGWKAKAS
ncbi:MAG TPA: DUF1761 domain-containing protein [Candidatus Acidoferrales bacterium]|nr:DUF1761 domain-containing protein [Candidatus Acidoferrales bacterium]